MLCKGSANQSEIKKNRLFFCSSLCNLKKCCNFAPLFAHNLKLINFR